MSNTHIIRLRIVALVLLFINGLSALAAGLGLMLDPSGKGLGMTTDYLKDSFLPDFFIPGILLFFFNGVLSMGVAVVTILKRRYYPLLIILQGVVLSGWIVVQLFLVDYWYPLHAVMLAVGLVLVMLGLRLYKKKV